MKETLRGVKAQKGEALRGNRWRRRCSVSKKNVFNFQFPASPRSPVARPPRGRRVRSEGEKVPVFWEEPVKMMRAINVTAGQLHY